jgi:hypothetical protein
MTSISLPDIDKVGSTLKHLITPRRAKTKGSKKQEKKELDE